MNPGKPLLFALVATGLFTFPVTTATPIIAVVDSRLTDQNMFLGRILKTNANVIISHENDTLSTFREVCDIVKEGAVVLLDISSPMVGPLLRSFARANRLVFMTLLDESFILRIDSEDEFYIQIQPPGNAMLNVVADIIKYDNLTNVAILYDNSFNLHQIPRRVVSGILSHHIYQMISRTNMAQLLQRLIDLEIENVIVIGSAINIDYVLGEANSYEKLKGENVNWFALTKDTRLTCDKCQSKVRVVIAEGESNFETKLGYLKFMKEIDTSFNSLNIKIEEAFVYDLLNILKDRIPDTLQLNHSNGCYGYTNLTNETQTLNGDIINNFKNVNHTGVFGPFISESKVIRQKIKLNLKRVEFADGKQRSTSQLGHWTQDEGLNVTVDSLINEKSQKKYRVVVIPEYPPFIYKMETSVNGTSRGYTYKGFCIDLFKELAHQLNFAYEFYETKDGLFGSLNEDGTWNGAINELMEKRADIAIGPISVMSERENVVDFTVPFHEPVGLTILMKKHKFEYSLHKFLTVLEADVWGCIVASFFLFSILMWLFDKFSPFSYQNNPDSSTGPEKRIFTLKEGIWFCMTSLTPQGGGEAPKAVSGRLVAATWWLYGFLLIAFYTANLAAFLTVTRLDKSISSLEDLSKQQSKKYGPMNGTSALVYFTRMKQIESQFYEIWKDMSLNDSLGPVARAKLAVWDYPVSEQFTKLKDRMFVPNSHAEAMSMIKSGEFAFIDDATRNKYQTLTDCDVGEIGEEFSRKPFAFAVVQGSPLRAQLSNVLLDLANDRKLEEFTNTWWDDNPEKKECPTIEDESDGISIMNIGGVFLVIAIGTGLSVMAFIVEYYYYKIKPKKEARMYKCSTQGGPISRLESETSLSDIKVQENGTDDSRNRGITRPDIANTLNNQSRVVRPRNGYTTNSKKCKKKLSNIQNQDGHSKQNGHVSNGEANNSYFTFDTEDSLSERYPDINNGEIQESFSEKL